MDPQNLYVAPLLSNVASAYKNRQMIANRILTEVQVPKKRVKYPILDRASYFKLADTKYAQDGSVNVLDPKVSQGEAALETHALSAWIDEQEEDENDLGVAIEALKTDNLTAQMWLRLEVDVANLLRSTAVLTEHDTLSGTTQWSDFANSDPLAAVSVAADSMIVKPNTFVAGRPVVSKLRRHPKILEVTKYTQRGIVPMEALAEAFEVDEIIVGEAVIDSAAPGLAESRGFVWGKDAILCYRAPQQASPLLDQPSIGYLPRWKGGSLAMPWRVYRAPKNPQKGTGGGSQFIKVETTYKAIVTSALLGYLWKNAVA